MFDGAELAGITQLMMHSLSNSEFAVAKPQSVVCQVSRVKLSAELQCSPGNILSRTLMAVLTQYT